MEDETLSSVVKTPEDILQTSLSQVSPQCLSPVIIVDLFPSLLSPHFSQCANLSADQLWRNYEEARNWLQAKKLPPDIDKAGVFCNDRIDLSEVEVYGYDYGQGQTNISLVIR